MEIPFLAQFLQTSSIPLVELVYLFVLSIFVLIIVEFYKNIKYKTK